jgi:hypothetical protein
MVDDPEAEARKILLGRRDATRGETFRMKGLS